MNFGVQASIASTLTVPCGRHHARGVPVGPRLTDQLASKSTTILLGTIMSSLLLAEQQVCHVFSAATCTVNVAAPLVANASRLARSNCTCGKVRATSTASSWTFVSDKEPFFCPGALDASSLAGGGWDGGLGVSGGEWFLFCLAFWVARCSSPERP